MGQVHYGAARGTPGSRSEVRPGQQSGPSRVAHGAPAFRHGGVIWDTGDLYPWGRCPGSARSAERRLTTGQLERTETGRALGVTETPELRWTGRTADGPVKCSYNCGQREAVTSDARAPSEQLTGRRSGRVSDETTTERMWSRGRRGAAAATGFCLGEVHAATGMFYSALSPVLRRTYHA